MRAHQVFKITLALSDGCLPGPDAPVEFLWYCADPFGDRRAIHVSRSGSLAEPGVWHESRFSIGAAEAEAIDALVVEMGLPGRSLDVHGVPDTSDAQHNTSMHGITLDGSAFHLDLQMYCSGFEGADAEAFRRLLTRLFALVGEQR